jgi:LmbE family N-acetylglucosaminyl deacetylase
MENDADIYYLAPHLDDAVFSGGGHMARAIRGGRRVEAITFFTADTRSDLESPLIRDLHSRCGMGADAGERRRTEDAEACRRLGATFRHIGLADAMYRTDVSERAIYVTRESLFQPPRETELVELLGVHIAALPESAMIVAPLAVGGHIDHRLLRMAAESVRGNRLWYYEDFPYAQKFGAIWRATGNPFAWTREVVTLDEVDLASWVDAVRAYASQTAAIFHGDADMEYKVRRYARRRGGQRLWRRR